MSRELASTRGAENMARVAVRHIGEVFDAQVVVLFPDATARIRWPKGTAEPASLRDADLSVAQWVQDNGKPAGLGTDTLPGAAARYLPLTASGGGQPIVLGVLALLPASTRRLLLPEQAHLLDTFAAQLALALERAELADRAQAAQVQIETESLRNSLLSAISHDLRTPLTVISGAASSIADAGDKLEEGTRRELAQSIVSQAAQMTQLISNVLDMMRLESGRQTARLEWITLEEVVGSAVHRLSAQLATHVVETRFDGAPALVRADPVLLEQLVFNLLENAARHTPPGTRVSISARRAGDVLEMLVADDGPGFPAGLDLRRLFEKFERGRLEGSTGGVGLGLAICRAIVELHGGEIRAERIPAGGALFVVSLPLSEQAPVVDAEDAA
jgi:two-component system sensor histidine kinase KdpD